LLTVNSNTVDAANGLDENVNVAATVDVPIFVQETALKDVAVEQVRDEGKVTSVGKVKVNLSVEN